MNNGLSPKSGRLMNQIRDVLLIYHYVSSIDQLNSHLITDIRQIMPAPDQNTLACWF